MLFNSQVAHWGQRQSTPDEGMQGGPWGDKRRAPGPAPRWELRGLKRAPRTRDFVPVMPGRHDSPARVRYHAAFGVRGLGLSRVPRFTRGGEGAGPSDIRGLLCTAPPRTVAKWERTK